HARADVPREVSMLALAEPALAPITVPKSLPAPTKDFRTYPTVGPFACFDQSLPRSLARRRHGFSTLCRAAAGRDSRAFPAVLADGFGLLLEQLAKADGEVA